MKDINRQILNLAWPAIATNITTPLLSLADIAIVGHLGGNLIAAVAVGSTVFNILYWLFAFLRMGTSGLTAQAYGAADSEAQIKILKRGLTIGCVASVVLLLLTPLMSNAVIGWVDGSQSGINIDAEKYFRVAICGAPGVLASYVFSGWLLGMQTTKPIMWIALVTNVLNIALSVVFVYVMHLGVEGLGLGTAVSQTVGAIIGGLTVLSKLRKQQTDKECTHPIVLTWKRFFSINRDILLRTLCLASVTLWFTHQGSTLGEDILSANTILMQLFLLFSYFMDGFAFGGEALAGRYSGACDKDMLRRTVTALFRWGLATALIFTLLYFAVGDVFLSLLTNDSGVLTKAEDYRYWAILIPFTGFSAFTWDGIFIGMTRTKYLLLSMLGAVVVFFGILMATDFFMKQLSASESNHILWLAFVSYLAVRGLTAWWLYRRDVSKW